MEESNLKKNQNSAAAASAIVDPTTEATVEVADAAIKKAPVNTDAMMSDEEDRKPAYVPPDEEPPTVRPGAVRVGGDDDYNDMEDECLYNENGDEGGTEILVVSDEEDRKPAYAPPDEEPPTVRPGAVRVGGDDDYNDMEDEYLYNENGDEGGTEILVVDPEDEGPPTVRPGAVRIGGDDDYDDMEDDLLYNKQGNEGGTEIVVIDSEEEPMAEEEPTIEEKPAAGKTALTDDAEEEKKHKRKYWVILSLILLEIVILVIVLVAWKPQRDTTQIIIRGGSGGSSQENIVHNINSILCDGSDTFEYYTTMCNSNGDGFQVLEGTCQNGIPVNAIEDEVLCPSQRPHCMVCGEDKDTPFATCVSKNISDTLQACANIEQSICDAKLELDYEVNHTSCVGSRVFSRHKEECVNGTLTPFPLDFHKCGSKGMSVSAATKCLDCPSMNQVACVDETMTCGNIWNIEPTISPRPTITPPSSSPSSQPSSSPTETPLTRCDAKTDNFDYEITVCNSDGDGYQEEQRLCAGGSETTIILTKNTCPAERPHCVMCADDAVATCASSPDLANECASGTKLDDETFCASGLFDYEWRSPYCFANRFVLSNEITCINGALNKKAGKQRGCGLTNNNNVCRGALSNFCPDQSLAVCASEETTCEDIWAAPQAPPTLSPTLSPTTISPTTISPTYSPTIITTIKAPVTAPPVTVPPVTNNSPVFIFPSIAPTTAPISSTAAPGGDVMVTLRTTTISDYCSGSNTTQYQKVENFLSTNNNKGPIYVLEFLNFATNDIATPESYQSFLLSLGGGSRLVFSMKKISQFTASPDPPLEWTHAYIMEYPNGGADFDNLYLNNTQVPSVLSIRPQPYAIYMATKNSTGSELYPNLFSENTIEPQFLGFHGLHITNRSFVDEFDALTETMKVENGFRTQAWLDIGATCGSSVPINQFRIETTLSLKDYGNVLTNPLWGEASLLREKGITQNSFSGFADHHGRITNLYNNLY